MTLEISLKPPFSLPRLLQAKEDEPPRQKYRWIGQGGNQPQNQPKRGESPQRPNKSDENGLESITLGDVDKAFRFFKPQLVPSPFDGWMARNFFCTLHLKHPGKNRPSAVFGRVGSCYPSEDQIENIEQLELLVPNQAGKPRVLNIHAEDIQKRTQIYFVRVRFLALEEEIAEFDGSDSLFWMNGFSPEFHTSYLELLDMTERNQSSSPWLYVIGSRWFAKSIPESRQPDIRTKLDKMVSVWGKHVFNYHPDWLTQETHRLNRELDYQNGFTPHVLIEPKNPEQTADIVARKFDEVFQEAIRSSTLSFFLK